MPKQNGRLDWKSQLVKSIVKIQQSEAQSIVKENQKFSSIKSKSKLVREFSSYQKEDLLT